MLLLSINSLYKQVIGKKRNLQFSIFNLKSEFSFRDYNIGLYHQEAVKTKET